MIETEKLQVLLMRFCGFYMVIHAALHFIALIILLFTLMKYFPNFQAEVLNPIITNASDSLCYILLGLLVLKSSKFKRFICNTGVFVSERYAAVSLIVTRLIIVLFAAIIAKNVLRILVSLLVRLSLNSINLDNPNKFFYLNNNLWLLLYTDTILPLNMLDFARDIFVNLFIVSLLWYLSKTIALLAAKNMDCD